MIEKDPKQEENLVKRKASLIARVRRPLSAILILGMLATGCSNLTGDEPNDDPTNNSQTDPGNGKENGGQNDKYKDYSDLFRYIKNNEYYQSEIARLKEVSIDPINIATELNKTLYHCIPFTFLKNEGYNIDALKNSNAYIRCSSFIKENEPNNLYMLISILHENESTPYYDHYCIRYTLTDQEIQEYPQYFPTNAYTYEGCFINDAISATKDVTIISKAKMSEEAKDNIESFITANIRNKFPNADCGSIALKSVDIENNTFEVYAFADRNNRDSTFVAIPLKAGWYTQLEVHDDIYYGPITRDNKYGYEWGSDCASSTVYDVDYFSNAIHNNIRKFIDVEEKLENLIN